MPSEGSITLWLHDLKSGDEAAAEKIWDRYFRRLVDLARKKLAGASRSVTDEEDAALGALDSFCRRARADGFPALDDRQSLWRLLVVITARKAYDQIEYQRRQKRDGRTAGSRPGPGHGQGRSCWQVESLFDREPTPEDVVQMADEVRNLLAGLGDGRLRRIALRKLEGYSNAEIANQEGCAVRTVERKLRLIREKWESRLGH